PERGAVPMPCRSVHIETCPNAGAAAAEPRIHPHRPLPPWPGSDPRHGHSRRGGPDDLAPSGSPPPGGPPLSANKIGGSKKASHFVRSGSIGSSFSSFALSSSSSAL